MMELREVSFIFGICLPGLMTSILCQFSFFPFCLVLIFYKILTYRMICARDMALQGKSSSIDHAFSFMSDFEHVLSVQDVVFLLVSY